MRKEYQEKIEVSLEGVPYGFNERFVAFNPEYKEEFDDTATVLANLNLRTLEGKFIF